MYDTKSGIYPEGQYLVGEDIKRGKYLLKAKKNKEATISLYENYEKFVKQERLVYGSFEEDYYVALREYGMYIVVDNADIERIPLADEELSIREIIDSNFAWFIDGGIRTYTNEFYFDLNRMLYVKWDSSSEKREIQGYAMKIVDEKTIYVAGVNSLYEKPATMTVVNDRTLRIIFFDDRHNKGDYFLVKTDKKE